MSTDAREYLYGDIAKKKTRVDELMALADREARDNTPEEMAEITGNMTRIKEHQLEIKRIDDRANLREQMELLSGLGGDKPASVEASPAARTPGEAFVQSAEYKGLVSEAKEHGMRKFPTMAIEFKAEGDSPVLTSDFTNADAIMPSWDPTLRAPGFFQPPVRITDLLPTSAVSGGSTVMYPIVKVRTGPSGNPTAEGTAKKEAKFAFDQGTATIEKNTAYVTMSEEFFQDAPALAAYINNQMGLMVLQVEEGSIYGELTSSISTVDGTEIGGDNGFDAIRSAIVSVQLNGGNPSGVVLHPNDAAFLDIQRAVAGDGGYFGGGPFGGPRTSVWGTLTYVISTAVTEGLALVGDFRLGATLYVKGGLRVESSNSAGDNFENNLISVRAEKRSIAGVHNPELFIQANLGSS